MADQMQTESLDQGATKDSSSINAPGATVNSDDKTSSLAFHNDGTDEESSADRDEGVNDMTNRSINEESGNEVNDKIADDENGIIHETIIKGGSNKVDENKKGNETLSLGANETVGKGEDTFVKRSSETVYRGNGRKYSESNDEVTQKSNNGANDKENNETSDTSHTETKTGTDKKTHAGERHENKTSNDETNLMTSKSGGDERNDEAAQKGNTPNEKGNNERNDTTHVEKSKAGIDKITHEGERHENKTSNDETNLMTSKPADERNDEATHKGNNANDKGNNERNDTSHVEKTKTGTGKITHEGVSNENKTDNDKTNTLIIEPANERNDEETQNRNNAIDKGYNESSDTSHAEKTIPGTDKTMHESDENKTENDVTNVLIGKPANEKHDEASYNGEGETNNDEKDIVTDSVNADQIDANAKEMGETCGGDSSSNEERNDSETPDEKMIADIDRRETANNETNDEIIPEDAICNEDANVPQVAPMPCHNESPEAYVESHGKKKKGVLQDFNPFKRGTKNKKNETHIPSSQPKQPSVTYSIEADVNSRDEKENESSNEKHISKFGFLQKLKSNKTKDTNILDRTPGACRSMADQTQTESLDQGATKDSSAEGNGGVNGMTNKTINEESRTDVNDKIDKECQKRNSGADDKENNESSDTSHTEKTIPGTDKTTHEGESHEHKGGNDQTNVMIGIPANERHNEASYNREGETNNDEKGIVTENVNADQIDANAKEMGKTCGGDSSSNKEGNDSETPDEKMITGSDRQETANKETNDETIPEGTFYNEDTNIPQDVPMACPNESPEAYEESYGKKKKGSIAGFLQNVISFKKGTKNKKNETHIPSSPPKQPCVTNSIEADMNSRDEKENESSNEKHMSKFGFLQKLKSNKTKDTNILDRTPGACSIEEDVKPHDDKKSASSNEKPMCNLGCLPKSKSNKKKDTDISESQAKGAPDACRDSMPIQDEDKQWKKKHQQLINQTQEEKKSNAITLNEMTELLRARDGELGEYRSVVQRNNADISQLTAQIQQLQEDKSDLLLRLSKVASAKLTKNNPNIADLSDANRPTKLAEQFSELYDNEYTDAIEEQQGIEEQAAIESMLTLLQAANEECVELARKQEHGKTCLTTFSFKVDQYPILRERSMLTDSGDNECLIVKTTIDQETDEVRIEIQLPDEHSKSLSDIRRLCATKVEEDCSMSKIIASKIALQRGITPESGPKTLAYITKCAKLCWYMVIKEPPVLVGFHAVVDGEHFNKDMYKSYTKAGEFLDFVVWPPLYLHKDGPLLCKGVAQGK